MIRRLAAQHGVQRVELEDQRAQTVRQDVVDLPGCVGPLGQAGGPGVLFPGPFGIGQAQLGLLGPQDVLLAAGGAQESDDGDGAESDIARALVGGEDADGGGHHGQSGHEAPLAELEAGAGAEPDEDQQHRRADGRLVAGQNATAHRGEHRDRLHDG